MKPTFIVTGLPRSRTAWLANLFCEGSVLCVHEPVVHVPEGPIGVRPFLDEFAAEVVGMADSSAPLFWDTYAPAFLPCPVVIVERPLEVCAASLHEHSGVPLESLIPVLKQVRDGLTRIKSTVPALTVQFDDLNSLDVLQNIWTYCVPSVEFNLERALILQTLNVQQPFKIPQCLGSQP